MKILHVAEGARFAGIESHLMAMFGELAGREDTSAELAVFHAGPLAQRAAALGVPVHMIERRGKYDRRAARRLAACIADGGAQIVHTHGYLANVVADHAASRHNAPLVTTVHGAAEPFGGFAGLKMRLNLALDQRVMRRRCARVIAVAEHLKNRLVADGVPGDKIAVVYNGIAAAGEATLDGDEARRRWNLTPDEQVISFVGRLEPVKDPLLFVAFAREVVRDVPRAVFLVAGDGPLEEETRRAVAEARLADRFRFLGFVDDLEPVFAATDLYVLTSRHEGIPNAALEAMRVQVPVLAPAVGGLPELLAGLDGALADGRTASELASRAVEFLVDPGRRALAGQAARERFLAQFTAATMVQNTRRLYLDVLGGKS